MKGTKYLSEIIDISTLKKELKHLQGVAKQFLHWILFLDYVKIQNMKQFI